MLSAGVIAAAGLALSATPALATPIVNLYAVPSGGATSGICLQTGPCTLAWAIHEVDTNNLLVDGASAIINLAAGTYTNAGASPNYVVSESGATPQGVAIEGPGTSQPTAILNGQGLYQILEVTAPYYTLIQGVEFENGYVAGYGADVLADTSHIGTVGLGSDIVTGGYSSAGGQADNVGSGFLTLANSTVENSSSGTDGSVVTGSNGGLTVTESTYTNNYDAVVMASGSTSPVTIDNSTIAHNAGYGLFDDSNLAAAVILSTISGNTDGGIATVAGPSEVVDLVGSILASNANKDCSIGGMAVTDDSDNVLDDSSCGFTGVHGSKVVSTAAIGLGALADNGGNILTERITPSSAAYDVVPGVGASSACQMYSEDEHGVAELQGSATTCDAGAYQFAPPVISPASPASAEPGTSLTLPGSNLQNVTVTFGAAHVPAAITGGDSSSVVVTVPRMATGSQPVTVTNVDGTATDAFTVSGPTITTTSLTSAEVGHPYSAAITTSGGAAPLTWSITSGALPAGLSISNTGGIHGTPTTATSDTFTVSITDADGASTTASISLDVLKPQVAIHSSGLKFKKDSAPVKLSCTTAACAGTIKLEKTSHKHVHHGHKTKTITVTTILASGFYTLGAGDTASFKIKPTGADHAALAGVASTPAHLTLVVTDTGGSSARRTVKVT
jgi:hypothetical protein